MAAPEVLCTKRQRPDGFRSFEHAHWNVMRAWERLLLALPNLSAARQRVVRHQIAGVAYRLGQYRLLDGRPREARLDARHALRSNWRSARAAMLLALSYAPPSLARSILRAWSRYRTDAKPRASA
jgi:hypothetical protein